MADHILKSWAVTGRLRATTDERQPGAHAVDAGRCVGVPAAGATSNAYDPEILDMTNVMVIRGTGI